MERMTLFLLRHRKAVIAVTLLLVAICGFLMLLVEQNYAMAEYLPAEANSKQAIDVMKNEFDIQGSVEVLLKDCTIPEAMDFKSLLLDMPQVRTAAWLDAAADVTTPLALIDSSLLDTYYKDGCARMQVQFRKADEHPETIAAVEHIMSILPEDSFITGAAHTAYLDRHTMSGNLLMSVVITLVLLLVIMIVCVNSVFEVVLFLVAIGVAIVLNLGTNIIFGEISYMTFACAAILQLAISMDYSIFLLERFHQERHLGGDLNAAMARAVKNSFSSICASASTTVAGFLALIIMSYALGRDMGLVLAKGILFSLICVLFLLPVLGVMSVKLIDKTRHRTLIPSMGRVQKLLSGRIKYVLALLLVVLAVFSYLGQSRNTFTYAASASTDYGRQEMETVYGYTNNFVLFVPRGDELTERALAEELQELPDVTSVVGYYTVAPKGIPDSFLPDMVRDQFLSENYSMYRMTFDLPDESAEAYAAVENVRNAANAAYPGGDVYLAGSTPTYYDIRETTAVDYTLVTWASILAVGLILVLTFKSITLPLLLLLVIQTSIWINMSIPYFSGEGLMFIGYMIVSSMQLGSTIDYAILMTNYYMDERTLYPKDEAVIRAVDGAGKSIAISAIVLTVAGYVFQFAFDKPDIQILGTLIGRGALMSGILTIFILPQLLTICDGLIMRTTIGGRKRLEVKGSAASGR